MGGGAVGSAGTPTPRRAGPSFSLVAAVSSSDVAQSLLRSEPIERVDISRTVFACTFIKHAARWLESPSSARVSSVVACFWLSQCGVASLPFLETPIASWAVTCAVTLLSLPALVMMAGNLSMDMVGRLVRENEFQCCVVLNTTQWVVVAIAFGLDWRVCVWIVEWWVVQLALATDADFRRCAQRLRLGVAACLVTALYLGYSLSGALGRSFRPIFTISNRSSSANDLLQWTASTLLVLLLRGMYVQRRPRGKRAAGKAADPTSVVVYCTTVRARLTLGKAADREPLRQLDSSLAVVSAATGVALVRSKTLPAYVDITDTLVRAPCPLPEEGIPRTPFVLLYTTAVLSFIATCVATFLSQIHAVTHPDAYTAPLLAASALAGTVTFCVLTARFYHRRLVRELLGTFDLAFASLQFLAGGGLLCELLDWDARCINVVSWTLWFHWLLCLDALTPSMRAYLRLKKLATTPIALFLLYGLGGPFVVLYGYANTKFYDRELAAHVRLSTCVLSRVLTLWMWCAHLVWDLGVRDDSEFIFLKDRVEYAVPRGALLAPSATTPGNAVVPTAHASPPPSQSPAMPTALSTPAPTPSSSPSPPFME